MEDKTIHLGGGLIKPPVKKVFKYSLPDRDGVIKLPLNANITSCQLQYGKPVIWAEVNPDETREVELSIKHVMTGGDVPEGYQQLATFLTNNDSFVIHVYMRVMQ